MSEDSNFISKKKPQGFGIDERRWGLDFFGSSGKGMVPKENLEALVNSSGLTPLGLGIDVRKGILKTMPVCEGLSSTEFTENKEIFKDSSGLTPLRPFVRKQKKEVLE